MNLTNTVLEETLDNQQQSNIVVTEAERLDEMKPQPDVENGTIVQDTEGRSEKIVYDKDEDGNVTGWHKEAVSE